MPKHPQKKCMECALLAIEEVLPLHGVDGDGCWDPELCKKRRYYYKNRHTMNQTRRRIRRSEVAKQALEDDTLPDPLSFSSPLVGASSSEQVMELTPPPPHFPVSAVLVLYRQGNNTPVHALEVEIWQGDRQIAHVKPIHCLGMKGPEVTAYIQAILEMLKPQFGIQRFEDVIKQLHPSQCPLRPCPLTNPPNLGTRIL